MKKLLLAILAITTLGFGAKSQTADTIYVNALATGNNDGTSWTDAYIELTSALSNSDTLDQVWVAAGTYKPSAAGNRSLAFEPVAELYGGFNGTETQLAQRDWAANPTILSGDIGIVGDSTDNSRTVVKPANTDHTLIDGFTISDGYADGAAFEQRYGAGIYIDNQNTPITIKNCIIKDNMANSDVGLYCVFNQASTAKDVTIENTRFTNNYGRWGAAFTISAYSGAINIILVNCLIDNNTVDVFPVNSTNTATQPFSGGRFYCSSPGVINGFLINCTFSGNTDNSTLNDADKSVFGVQGANNSTEIHNSIFYDNDVNTTNASVGFGNNISNTPSMVAVSNTISEDVMGNLSYVYSTNNTQVDPLFTNPNSNDFTLQNGSPAINTGSTSGLETYIPVTDLAGNARIEDVIDLGCYESSFGGGDTIYVNQNATGNNDGTSWADAYPELILATESTASSKQIWVAAGTYKPSSIGDREAAFKPKASMYGGFNGTETQLSQRDWVANPTILSGDIGIIGDNTDNSESVIEITTGEDAIVIDGFTISEGYADGGGLEHRYGGGIYISNFLYPITVKNCTIKNNSAHYEAGLHYSSYNAPSTTKYLTIENTRFTNNQARFAAAFSVMARDSSLVKALVVNCLIDANQIVAFPTASPEPAGVFPGGRFFQDNFGEVDGDIINCTFIGNIDNSVVADSSKSVFGIQNANTTTVNDIDIYNTIFYGNTINPTKSSVGYGTSALYKPGNVNVYNTISEDVMENAAFVTSTNNIQIDPLFTSATDFTLQSGSPAINSGDTANISALIPVKDIANNNRYNDTIDMGCYESTWMVGVSKQIGNNKISVYPNPTSDLLTIRNINSTIERISVIDLTGKTVETIVSTINTIDVSHLSSGVYLLQINTDNEVFNSRFIKE